jgi:hypothetical protein
MSMGKDGSGAMKMQPAERGSRGKGISIVKIFEFKKI